jgi:hypothetical protein
MVTSSFRNPDTGSDLFGGHQPGKKFKGTIISPFRIFRKTTGRKLPALQMVGQALTTDAFAGAGFITAVTPAEVFFLITLHECSFAGHPWQSPHSTGIAALLPR